MALFTITDKGKALQAKVLAGTCKYAFTKIAVGDGYVSTSKDYATMNDLQNRKADIPLSVVAAHDAVCKVSGVLSNEKIAEAFYVREAGLFATDPDEGEILFCAHYYDMPSAVDSASGGAYTKEFTFEIGVDSADQVDVTVEQTGYITKDEMVDIVTTNPAILAAIKSVANAAVEEAMTDAIIATR